MNSNTKISTHNQPNITMKKIKIIFILFALIALTCCEDDSTQGGGDPTPQIGEFTQKHIKNVLVEDYTGTWCGYCPRVASAIEDVLSNTDKVIAIAIHDDNDMRYTYVGDMMTTFGIKGYPTGLVDRKYFWAYPETLSGLNSSIIEKAPLGIKVESSLVNRTASVTVSVEFAVDIPFDMSVVVCLTEDGIIADQVNYYDDGRGNPIIDFEHNHVLRKAATNIFGNPIGVEFQKKDMIATYNYTFSSLSANYNLDKCHIVAFVTKKGGRNAYNAQIVKLGENKGFQYLPI